MEEDGTAVVIREAELATTSECPIHRAAMGGNHSTPPEPISNDDPTSTPEAPEEPSETSAVIPSIQACCEQESSSPHPESDPQLTSFQPSAKKTKLSPVFPTLAKQPKTQAIYFQTLIKSGASPREVRQPQDNGCPGSGFSDLGKHELQPAGCPVQAPLGREAVYFQSSIKESKLSPTLAKQPNTQAIYFHAYTQRAPSSPAAAAQMQETAFSLAECGPLRSQVSPIFTSPASSSADVRSVRRTPALP